MTNIMLLYKEITALSRDHHRKWRLRSGDNYSYTAHTHWIPVSGVEFCRAALDYPIVFVKDNDKFAPIALLSLQPGHNDFIDGNGRWREHVYIPAFIRRYPFVVADTGAGNNELTVCIDPSCDRWNETDGQALFEADGKNTAYLDEMLRFMDSLRIELLRTAEFMDEIVQLDLLVQRTLNVQSVEGRRLQLQDIYMIDEEKMARLKAAELHRLNKRGTLAWVFAHLMSLANLPPLLSAGIPSSRQAVQESA